MSREHLNRKGRKPGSKDRVPRTAKRIIEEIFAQVGADETLIREAILAGVKAKPPVSLGYIKLVTEFHTGAPDLTIHGKTLVVHEHRDDR